MRNSGVPNPDSLFCLPIEQPFGGNSKFYCPSNLSNLQERGQDIKTSRLRLRDVRKRWRRAADVGLSCGEHSDYGCWTILSQVRGSFGACSDAEHGFRLSRQESSLLFARFRGKPKTGGRRKSSGRPNVNVADRGASNCFRLDEQELGPLKGSAFFFREFPSQPPCLASLPKLFCRLVSTLCS